MLHVLVAHEHQFRPIQAHGLDLQAHLALSWLPSRLLFNAQNIGSAELMKANDFWHVVLPPNLRWLVRHGGAVEMSECGRISGFRRYSGRRASPMIVRF